MKKNVLGLFSLLCIYSINVFASDLSYYPEVFLQGAKGSFRDAVLKTEIKKVLRMKHIKTSSNDKLAEDCGGASGCYGHVVAGYTKARQFLLGSFYLVKRSSDYAVREMYCQKEVGSEQFGGKKPGPNLIPDDRIVNVEHTWPQSKFSRKFNKEEQKSDVHHLYPTDSEMNSTRSSFEFGEVDKDAKSLKCSVARFGIPRSGGEDVFEPPQSHKGNVARSLFYFSVKYELPISPEEEATLRVWHKEDPVDQEERDRNDAIFAVQFSKNPFVDLPELADRISDY